MSQTALKLSPSGRRDIARPRQVALATWVGRRRPDRCLVGAHHVCRALTWSVEADRDLLVEHHLPRGRVVLMPD